MYQRVIPVQERLLDPAIPQRKQKQYPVERIGRAWLCLPDERLPAPEIWVPCWESPGVPLAGLILKPRKHLVRRVGAVEPRVLIRQQKLPIEADDDRKQKGGVEQW